MRVERTVGALCAALLAACAFAAGLRTAASPPAGTASPQEWPTTWDDRPLRPLALSEVERRFAAQFPGAIGRLTDGHREFVLRRVDQPTRMLHPAQDCYRALGYRIADVRLEADAARRRWRCFIAERGGQSWRVCERIVDTEGQAFTDTSAWFWAALLGRSTGPWQTITTAEPA